MTKIPKIAPADLCQCLLGHAVPSGETIREGAILRGTEMDVQSEPLYYIGWPCSDAERLAAIHERWPGYNPHR